MTESEELASRVVEQFRDGLGMDEILAELYMAEPGEVDRALRTIAAREDPGVIELLALIAASGQQPLLGPAIEALSRHQTAEAAQALAKIAEGAPDKALRKLARRGLHRLRAAGVAAPEAPPSAAEPAVVRPAVRYYKAMLSSIDFQGTRGVMIGVERPSGGIDEVFAVLGEDEGLKDCHTTQTNRKSFNRDLDEMRRLMSIVTWVEAPPSYCHHLIHKYAEKARARGTLSSDRARAVHVLGPPPSGHAQPLVYERIPAEEVRNSPLLLQRGPELLQEPELQGWLLEPETASPYATAVQAAQQSALVLSDHIKAERISRILEGAIDELFPPPARESYARRLEETAYVLLQTGRAEQARVAVACALALREQPQLVAHSNLFLRRLVARSIDYVLERKPEVRQRPSGLIIP